MVNTPFKPRTFRDLTVAMDIFRHPPDSLQKALNFVWFQAIWFLAIIFQYEYIWLIGLLFIVFFAVTSFPQRDALLMAVVALVGVVVDSLLTATKIFIFAEHAATLLPIPWWLVALWAAFSLTLLHSLRYLNRHLLLSAVLGAIFGPLSYWAGERLGAVSFGHDLVVTLAILAGVWSIIMPLCFYLSTTFLVRHQRAT